MAQVAAELAQATASTRYLSNFFKNCWDAFLERSERQTSRVYEDAPWAVLRAALAMARPLSRRNFRRPR